MLVVRTKNGLHVVVCFGDEWMLMPVSDIEVLGFDGEIWRIE